jgi:hypothetical protein
VLEDSLGGKVAKTLLFRLSESGTLEHFRKVVLLSSPKDQYVPAYSARIQVSRLAVHWGCLITNLSSYLPRGHMGSLCDLYRVTTSVILPQLRCSITWHAYVLS